MEPIDAALAKVKEILAGSPSADFIPGVRKDITTSTGLVAYNLEPAARLLVPMTTPLRNRIPRVNNTRGGTAAHWKLITALDNARTDVFTAEGTKAGTISITTADKSATYATISKGDNITFQAVKAALSFEDALAKMPLRLLKDVMIDEERAIIGGRIAALGAVAAPTCTPITTGGTIIDTTYYVVCRAVTAIGRGKKSATATAVVTTGTDHLNSIGCHSAYVEGAVKYEWYVGTVDDGSEKLEATTYTNSVNLTAIAGTGATLPADNSADANGFDGLLALLTAANGAYVHTLATGADGVGTKLALSDLDTMFQSLWDSSRANPEVLEVASQQAIDITNLVLAANGGPTLYVASGDKTEIGAVTGGYRVTHYINKVTGRPVQLEVNPYMPKGTLSALSFEIPFSASEITNGIEVETQQDYLQIDYPIVAPKYEKEVFVIEVLKLYFALGCGVIRNIANG
jgi:hypothetical protein